MISSLFYANVSNDITISEIIENIKKEKKGNLEEIQKLYDLIEDSKR